MSFVATVRATYYPVSFIGCIKLHCYCNQIFTHFYDGKSLINCRVPQLMSVLSTEFMSAFDMFSVFVEIDFVVIDWGWSHPAEDLLLAPIIVLMVEVPEFPPEMANRAELLESNEFLVESLVIESKKITKHNNSINDWMIYFNNWLWRKRKFQYQTKILINISHSWPPPKTWIIMCVSTSAT